MKMDISGRHFQVTPALKEYVTGKIEKFDKFSLKLEQAHIVLEVQKFHQVCEIVLSGKNLKIRAKEENADMYAAFDKCFEVIELQLRRQHDKIKDHKARRYKTKSKEE